MKRAIVLKKNRKPQRSDVTLTKEVADTLVKLVSNGVKIFSRKYQDTPYLSIEIPDQNGGMKEVILRKVTIKSWIQRNNVVPETGMGFRDLMLDARREWDLKEEEKARKEMLQVADKKLKRVLKIRTKVPIRNMFGEVMKNEDGTDAKREDPRLLKIQVDTAMFVKERLDPVNWGKVEKNEHKVVIFSLSDLRKQKEELEKNGETIYEE